MRLIYVVVLVAAVAYGVWQMITPCQPGQVKVRGMISMECVSR